MPVARCPVCERAFDLAESPAPPFCSARCRQIDLVRWLGEAYYITGHGGEDPDEEGEGGDGVEPEE